MITKENTNKDLSLEALENRFFYVSEEVMASNPIPFPVPDPENPHKFFQHPIFPMMKVKHSFSFQMGAHGTCDSFIVVEPEDAYLNDYFTLFRTSKGTIWSAYRSLTGEPPVWDRLFNFGPDYFDWMFCQKKANFVLKGQGLPEFELDESKEGKTIFLKDRNDPNRNLALKAELVEITKVKSPETPQND
jgi:hypothetical protein